MKKILSILTLLMLITALLAGCSGDNGGETSTPSGSSTGETQKPSDEQPDEIRGRGISNKATFTHDGYIYYSYFKQGTLSALTGGTLKRMKPDGSGQQALTDFSVSYPALVDGTLYFISGALSDKNAIYSAPMGDTIARGSCTQIHEITEESFHNLTVVDGYIYVTLGADVFRMKPDGSEKTNLNIHLRTGYIGFTVYGGYIYYISDESSLMAISTDGQTVKTIYKGDEKRAMMSFTISGDTIYYATWEYDEALDEGTSRLGKCNLEGKAVDEKDEGRRLAYGGYFTDPDSGEVFAYLGKKIYNVSQNWKEVAENNNYDDFEIVGGRIIYISSEDGHPALSIPVGGGEAATIEP